MALITGTCEICKGQITPAETQLQFNRNRGLHMRKRHGVVGKRSNYPLKPFVSAARAQRLASLAKAREARWANRPSDNDPARLERNRKAREAYAIKMAARRGQTQTRPQLSRETILPEMGTMAHPCKLSSCPECGARFFVAKGQQ